MSPRTTSAHASQLKVSVSTLIARWPLPAKVPVVYSGGGDWGREGLRLRAAYGAELTCESVRKHFLCHRQQERSTRRLRWQACLDSKDIRGLEQQLNELCLTAKALQSFVANARRSNDAPGMFPPRVATHHCLNGISGDIAGALELLGNAEVHVRKYKRARRLVLAKKVVDPTTQTMQMNSAYPVDKDTGVQLSFEQMLGDQLDSVVSFGRRAEIFLDKAQTQTESLVVYPTLSPEQASIALRPHLQQAEKVCLSLHLDSARLSALTRARQLLAVWEHHQSQCQENNLFAEQVRYRMSHALMFHALADEQAVVVDLLQKQLTEARRSAKEHVQVARRKEPKPSEQKPRAVLVEDMVSTLRLSAAPTLSAAEQVLESDTDGWMDVKGRPQTLSFTARERIAHTFDQGTFPSALRSCLYHWRKHEAFMAASTSAVDEKSILQYIQEALAARGQWPQARVDGVGYLSPSLLNPSVMMRVINSLSTFLVTTDEDDGKIVSFRHREKRGR